MQQEIQVQRTINIATTPLESARTYSRNKFKEFNIDINRVLPNFNQNYILMQRYLNQYSLNIPRYKMPVIEPKDMEMFQQRLEQGHIDYYFPFLKKKTLPTSFKTQEHQESWLRKGLEDGAKSDDYFPWEIRRVPCSQLKPLQNQIWLNLLIKYIIQYGLPHQASSVTNTTIIISKDFYIIDGHHRWGEVMLYNPNLLMKSMYLPLSIEQLLQLGVSYGRAIGNKANL